MAVLRRWRLALRSFALCGAVVAGVLLAGAAGGLQAQDQSQETRAQGQPPVAIEVEGVSRLQPELMERALAGIQGSSGGQPPQLFFVGFAGYGPEAVFKREALAVRSLFDERFGTKGKSLVLVNHASTVRDIALANAPNLDRALQHIGALMNKDVDLLFLFLTSHGVENLLAVEMPGFAFHGLTPADLKAMLDGAQIKNRVIVVSACHSGSFIPALAGPTSLVIAAARADRTSFGCEDRREWTYFGDAFFNRALREERSFERAFDRARLIVRRWERQERLVRSLPQIAGGQALRQRLDELARGPAAQE